MKPHNPNPHRLTGGEHDIDVFTYYCSVCGAPLYGIVEFDLKCSGAEPVESEK